MTRAPEVVIVRTGSANLASVLAAFARLGVPARIGEDRRDIRDAQLLVLPGVGSFGPAAAQLAQQDIDREIVERVAAGRPLLAICLGLQLLCESSQESPGARGLGVIRANIERFPSTVRVPQMGWNTIRPSPGASLLRPGYAYFANSYRLTNLPTGWEGALSDHAGPFVAAIERGPILACQFHPELSGPFGLDCIRRWIDVATKGAIQDVTPDAAREGASC